jgi:high-affinity iron transporter
VPTGGAALPQTVAVTGEARSVTAEVDGSVARLRTEGTDGWEARTAFPTSTHRRVTRAGVAADEWIRTEDVPATGRPSTLTLDDLVGLFGRLPVGVSPSTAPGPFTARWTVRDTVTLSTVRGGVLGASRAERAVLTLRGGGLPSARTTTLDRTVWAVPEATVQRTAAAVVAADGRAAELALWATWLPIALGVAAATQALLALRDRRRRPVPIAPVPETDPSRGPPADAPTRSPEHAVR